MLRIKRVASYSVPKYPQELFHPWRGPAAQTYVRRGVASAALLALLESCDGDDGVWPGGRGTTGVPPVPPAITETEARVIITNVFADNGIALTPDVTLSVIGGAGDTTEVVLDGYNDSLRVGYEYVYYNDENVFTHDLVAQLDADAAASGPYIKAAYMSYRGEGGELEYIMQAFIDTLKAHGKI
jgi:hypothetical protein